MVINECSSDSGGKITEIIKNFQFERNKKFWKKFQD